MATLSDQYLRIDDDHYVAVDLDTNRVEILNRPALRAILADLRARKQAVVAPSDAELLAWAKQYHPLGDAAREKARIQVEIDQIKAVLANIGDPNA